MIYNKAQVIYLKCIDTMQVSFFQNPPHHGHVSDFSKGSEPLHCGVWPKLQEVEEKCCGTPECTLEVNGTLLQRYLCIWCGL